MKKFAVVLIVTIVSFSVACGQDEAVNKEKNSPINWLINLEEAQEIAETENKHVFIHFTGSDWCGWCMKLKDEIYSKQPFIDYVSENLVMVKIDFPKKIKQSEEIKQYNRSLAQKYQIRGFPTVLLLNPNGEIIGKTGYQRGGSEKYVEHLKEFINKE